MPDYPYSDNMYSALEDSDVEEQPFESPDQTDSDPAEDRNGHTPVHAHGLEYSVGAAGDDAYHQDQYNEEEVALSPTDGYFGRSETRPSSTSGTSFALQSDPYSPSSQDRGGHIHAASASASPPASGYAAATSSQVPHVPDIWVPDPSLEQGSTAESKAREAREEQELNSRRRAGQLDSPVALTTAAHRRAGGGATGSSDVNRYSTVSSSSGSGGPRYGYGPGLSSVTPYNQRYPPSSSAVLSRPQRSGTIYSERSSLFSEAPPAYTPSPTSPTTAVSSANYQTFPPPSSDRNNNGNMGRISESETRGLLAGQQYSSPQDMGGQPDDDDAYTFARIGDWRDRVRRRAPHFTGRTCKLFVLGLILLFVTIGFLVSSFVSVKDERQSHTPGGGGSGDSPSDKMPNTDHDGANLAYPPFDGELRWAEGHVCAAKQIKYPTQTFYFEEFSDKRSLTFLQDIKNNHGHNGQEVRVSGDVVVRRAGNGTPGPSITLQMISNDEAIEVGLDWDQNKQRLYIHTPRSLSSSASSSGTEPCLQIRATIWLLPESVLDRLDIQAVHLGVNLLDNLSLQITESVRIASTVGAIVAATDGNKDPKQLMHESIPSTFNLNSRRIEVKTTSNYIAGTWPLYDYLGLETVSGAVRAGVQPKEALREKPVPAVLYVHTTSGTIEVYEPIAEAAAIAAAAAAAAAAAVAVQPRAVEDIIPPRQYEVDLRTMSGWIRGSVAFGSICRVHTTSGDIDLNLLPVLDGSQISSFSFSSGHSTSVLETATTSGTTVINVLDALWRDIKTGSSSSSSSSSSSLPSSYYSSSSSSSPAIRVLDSRHSTTSSPIRVTYPAAWEGTIEADSLTGRLDVGGPGVEIIRRDEEFPGYKKHVLARKGKDGAGGELRCHTTSGSISVEVGS